MPRQNIQELVSGIRRIVLPTGKVAYLVGEKLFTTTDLMAHGLYYLNIPTAVMTALFLLPQDALEAGPYISTFALPLAALGAVALIVRKYYPVKNRERLLKIIARAFPEIFEALTDGANTLLFTWVSALVLAVDVDPNNGTNMSTETLIEYSAVPMVLGFTQFIVSMILNSHRLLKEEKIIPADSRYNSWVIRPTKGLAYLLAIVQEAATMQDLIRFGIMSVQLGFSTNFPPNNSVTTTARYAASIAFGLFTPTVKAAAGLTPCITTHETANNVAERVASYADRVSMYTSALVLAIWMSLSIPQDREALGPTGIAVDSIFWMFLTVFSFGFVAFNRLPESEVLPEDSYESDESPLNDHEHFLG
ncbi:MAG: hypothetical protein JSS53_04710 [Proteobacteria bacterium]|nr:hypothetical protein [Pseudomonadota bacterium]